MAKTGSPSEATPPQEQTQRKPRVIEKLSDSTVTYEDGRTERELTYEKESFRMHATADQKLVSNLSQITTAEFFNAINKHPFNTKKAVQELAALNESRKPAKVASDNKEGESEPTA